MIVIDHHDPIARRCKTRCAHMHRMIEAMMVTQNHTQFGLTVMIMDRHCQMFREPPDHFWIQGFAGAAYYAKSSLYALHGLRSGGNERTKSRRRTGQVSHVVFLDNPHQTVSRK